MTHFPPITDVRELPPDQAKGWQADQKEKVMREIREALLHPLFQKSMELFPTAFMKMPNGTTMDADQKTMTALNRWMSQICNNCFRKNDIVLYRCTCCGLVSYCSKTCQKAQWKRHKEYVKHLPDTPVPWEKDPHAVLLVDVSHIKDPKQGVQFKAGDNNMRLEFKASSGTQEVKN